MKRAKTQPSPSSGVVPARGTPVRLGADAAAVMGEFCRCCRVQPEHIMRALVESYLSNMCNDDTLISMADDARHIERKGSVLGGWWKPQPKFNLPGFDNWLERRGGIEKPATLVVLGTEAAAVMEKFCRYYRVKPEYVMRGIVESYMVDLCSDHHLLGIADDARHIERKGSVPGGWWDGKEFAPAGFENF